VTVVT
jgi:hypothetical protein